MKAQGGAIQRALSKHQALSFKPLLGCLVFQQWDAFGRARMARDLMNCKQQAGSDLTRLQVLLDS